MFKQEESKHCLNNPARLGNSSLQSFMFWPLKSDAVISLQSNHMKRTSNPPILKYSNFCIVWAFGSFSIADLKVQVSYSLKWLVNSIRFTLLLRALLFCWVELKYIQYLTFNNHDTKLKENPSTAKLKKKNQA